LKILIQMPLSIDDFLKLTNTGAVELLCEIDPNGSTLDELDEEMDAARSTINNRLAEARELGLMERMVVSEEGVRRRHVLTPKGATLRLRLDDSGTTGAYEQYKEARKRFETHAEHIRGAVSDEPTFYEKESDAGNLRRLQNRPLYSDDTDK
jgi:DNA-binding HxlR family transcriptional regulator